MTTWQDNISLHKGNPYLFSSLISFFGDIWPIIAPAASEEIQLSPAIVIAIDRF